MEANALPVDPSAMMEVNNLCGESSAAKIPSTLIASTKATPAPSKKTTAGFLLEDYRELRELPVMKETFFPNPKNVLWKELNPPTSFNMEDSYQYFEKYKDHPTLNFLLNQDLHRSIVLDKAIQDFNQMLDELGSRHGLDLSSYKLHTVIGDFLRFIRRLSTNQNLNIFLDIGIAIDDFVTQYDFLSIFTIPVLAGLTLAEFLIFALLSLFFLSVHIYGVDNAHLVTHCFCTLPFATERFQQQFKIQHQQESCVSNIKYSLKFVFNLCRAAYLDFQNGQILVAKQGLW